jgi:hypothetical protein
MRRLAFALACLSACGPATARAQGTPTVKDQIKAGTLDVSVPTSPGFAILDLTPDSVVRPASPRALATSLINGLNKDGNFQSGVALDTAPYLLWAGNGVTFQDYRTKPVVRFLSRAQFSIATVRVGGDDSKAARIGVGAHFTIFDFGDPRGDMEFLKKLETAGALALATNPPPLPSADPATQAELERLHNEKVLADVEALTKSVREERAKTGWNASTMLAGIAGAWQSADATMSNLGGDGRAMWTSVGYGFESVPGLQDTAQLVFHVRRRLNQSVSDDPATPRENMTLAGMRFRFGSATTIAAFEYAWLRTTPVVGESDTYSRLTLAGERRVAENLWLQVSLGGDRAGGPAAGKLFLLSELKWGLTQK